MIALLFGEPSGQKVGALLRSSRARMSTVNAAETVDVLVRRRRGDPDTVVPQVEQLLSLLVEPVVPSLELATRAGELRARHFRRDGRLSLSDCFVLATAEPGDRIATVDRLLASVAEDEGIEVVALDS